MKRSIKVLVSFLAVLIVTSVFSLAVMADSNKGWQKENGTWYYYDESGEKVTGWQKINSNWFYFEDSGAMVTGWKMIGNDWYRFNSVGVMQTGWVCVGGNWYYFYSSGKMASNTTVDGYSINSNGAAENIEGSNDEFDWMFSPGGELMVYCKKNTLKASGILDNQIRDRATSLKIMKSHDSQYEKIEIEDKAFYSFDAIKSIDIAVPYYDNELLGYKYLSELFNCNNINLYLQNGLSTFPVDFNSNNGIVNINRYYIICNNFF